MSTMINANQEQNENEDIVSQSANTRHVCGFRIGKDFYAISVLEVQEVIKAQQLTKIPKAPDYIKGLINLRGQIVTALSLRHLFGLPEYENSDYMNIIVRSNDSLYSLMVDQILDVMTVEEDRFEETPDSLVDKMSQYISGVYKLEGKLLIILDLKKVLSQEI